jgi:Bax protein
MSTKIIYLCILFFLVACGDSYPDIHKLPDKMTVVQKKQRFIDLILPAVLKVDAELNEKYQQVITQLNNQPTASAAMLAKYKVKNKQELLALLKPHPPSITLAQAAIESAWATSRFFVKANNIFGVWSFNPEDERIPALQKRGDKTIWLKKYSSIEDAVRDYYNVLATSSAFTEFRKLRTITSDPYKLVTKLDKYSEKGSKYGEELTNIIRYNKFSKYDSLSN